MDGSTQLSILHSMSFGGHFFCFFFLTFRHESSLEIGNYRQYKKLTKKCNNICKIFTYVR